MVIGMNRGGLGGVRGGGKGVGREGEVGCGGIYIG